MGHARVDFMVFNKTDALKNSETSLENIRGGVPC